MPAAAPIGVALATASTPARLPNAGVANVFIRLAQDSARIARAASAGLMKFWPIPPKIILHSRIAMTEPITGIQYGTVDGRFIASSMPVTTALKSPIVLRQ